MLDNILIHIGYHKTGTTWLQQELFTSDSNVFEPLSRKDRGQSTLAPNFYVSKDGYLLSSFDDNYENIKNEVYNIINLPNKDFIRKIPVLSSERLSGNPHAGGFDSKIIAYRIKNVFPDAKILIIFREQKQFLLSNYFQYLQNGGKKSLRKYLYTKYDWKIPFFSPYHLNYYLLIKEYINLFGEMKVLALPYELFNNNPDIFIKKIETFISAKIVLNSDSFNRKWNKKKYFFANYYFRHINIFKKSSLNHCIFFDSHIANSLSKYLITFIGKITIKLDYYLLHKLKIVLNNFVSDRYIKTNKQLSKLINIDLSKFDYY